MPHTQWPCLGQSRRWTLLGFEPATPACWRRLLPTRVAPAMPVSYNRSMKTSFGLKVLPWVVDGAGGLGAGKTSGAGTRGVDLNAAVGGRTGDSDTNGGESSNN